MYIVIIDLEREMRNILLSCLVLILIGCGSKSIPYSQNRDASEPNDVARAHYKWGLEYAKKGDLNQAVTELQIAIQNEPRWAIPYYNLGAVYGNMGEIDEAILAWERATQLDEDFSKAHYNLAVVYALKADDQQLYNAKSIFIRKSLDHLQEAIRVDNEAHISAKMDAAFDNIRELPEFKTIIKSAELKK